MEINTEINRVFGTEMAKLFAETISEEELRQTAQRSWNELRKSDWNRETQIDKEVKRALLERINAEIKNILETEEAKTDIKESAKEIVEKIRVAAEEKMVEAVSDQIAMLHTGYQGFGLQGMIEQVVHQMLNR